jgi:pimeloyl-ACP methyl ester carboxylesterase
MSLSRKTTRTAQGNHLALLALIAILILTACEPRQTPPPPTSAPTQAPPVTMTLPPPPPTDTPAPSTATPTQTPGKFIGSSCTFKLPPSLSEGVNLECGYLMVPSDRGDPNSPALQLAVAILRHPEGESAGDPIVYLEGGPGGSSLEFLNLVYDRRYAPVFEAGRDIILFDQRGVGVSRPPLDCPEQDALFFELLDNEVNGKTQTEEEMDQLNIEAMAVCASNLSSNADLADFTTNANAADVKDLAQALGYEQVNLWGTSYGTRLALEVMRDYPEILRSVVLDSTLPPQVNLFEEVPTNQMRSFDLVFDGCAADPDWTGLPRPAAGL